MEFNSVTELYQRLVPALQTKVTELKREGYDYLTIEDVWNYLKESKWKESRNLALHEMVSDILNSENIVIDDYFKHKMQKRTRRVYLES
ncbi:MAG: hypothetical protein IKE75_05845 [Bacilli bacterium]|nr:hypothetical protein [Bacilli bacterium]